MLEHDEPVGKGDRLERVVGHKDADSMKSGELARQLPPNLRADGDVQGR